MDKSAKVERLYALSMSGHDLETSTKDGGRREGKGAKNCQAVIDDSKDVQYR